MMCERPAPCIRDHEAGNLDRRAARTQSLDNGARKPSHAQVDQDVEREAVGIDQQRLRDAARTALGEQGERPALIGIERHQPAPCAWCSFQFGRASAPTMPQRVHTIFGPNVGTGTASGHRAASMTAW